MKFHAAILLARACNPRPHPRKLVDGINDGDGWPIACAMLFSGDVSEPNFTEPTLTVDSRARVNAPPINNDRASARQQAE